jgi:cell division protein FtsZ
MPSGKRASMREGPLSALFRKTEEAAEQAEEAGRAAQETTSPAPATPAVQDGRTRDPLYPHPSLGSTEQPPEDPPVRIPSPQERLRHAFGTDLPVDMLDRSALRSGSVSMSEPAEEEMAWGEARPAGQPVLRVVGVGGGGVNAVNRMVEAQVEGVEFIAVNTDLQSLQQSTADVTLHIGPQITRGLGAGSNPELGRQAAMEEYDRIKSLLKGSDMIFIAAGAGGGTGTGAAPIVARIAREIGALTVGIVTKPFGFEGSRRAQTAEVGVTSLAEEVDTLIVVPNNRLLSVLDKQTSMIDAFRVADDVLRQGVQGVSDLVTLPGLINLDFADVRTIMAEAGNALLGIGMGTGEGRAIAAAEAATASPLLETSMEGARKILLSITAPPDLSLWEVNEAAKAVAEAAHPEANIIFGAMVDEKLAHEVWVTVVATGYGADRPRRPERRGFEEPAGEPRVERRNGATRRTGLGVTELDVPEFIPRR